MQLSVFPHMHFNMQLDLPHPAKLPKQLAQFVDKSIFSIIHFSVHSAAPKQPVPQLSRAFTTSSFAEFQISLSSWSHCPAPWILTVSPELNNTLSNRKEIHSLIGKYLRYRFLQKWNYFITAFRARSATVNPSFFLIVNTIITRCARITLSTTIKASFILILFTIIASSILWKSTNFVIKLITFSSLNYVYICSYIFVKRYLFVE